MMVEPCWNQLISSPFLSLAVQGLTLAPISQVQGHVEESAA
jgi:hypothetical protein